jgi:drug/metabolite transporter (DMT)-like permease
MPPVQRAYRESTRAVGAVICVLGIVIVIVTIARGGGPLALGVVVGVAFAVLGALRVVIANRLTPPPEDKE